MDIKKLIEESKSTTENLTAVINFKLDPQMKQSFVDYSVKNNVSMGLLMRNIIKAILEDILEEKE